MSLEERVGTLEREQAKQGEQLRQLGSEVRGVGTDVKLLLERDAQRPQAMTFKSVAAGAIGLASIAGVGWWLIGTAPAVQELDRRMSKLDDPQIGRITRLEEANGWAVKVQRSGR